MSWLKSILPGHPVTRSAGHPVTRSPGHPVTHQSPGQPVTRSPASPGHPRHPVTRVTRVTRSPAAVPAGERGAVSLTRGTFRLRCSLRRARRGDSKNPKVLIGFAIQVISRCLACHGCWRGPRRPKKIRLRFARVFEIAALLPSPGAARWERSLPWANRADQHFHLPNLDFGRMP